MFAVFVVVLVLFAVFVLALFVVLFVVALDLGASVAFVFGASVFGVVVVVDFVEGVKDFVVLAGALNPPPSVVYGAAARLL